MSLLEDIFLQDEANEAQELERIIEGDEFDERPRSDSDDNSEKEDEAEEDKRHVDPQTVKAKRIVKNPRFILNPARLTGPRGIHLIPDHFKDFKFKGKGYEKDDLDLVLKKLEHWAYRLYPKFQFADCLKKIETLGKKKPVMVHLTKIRSDQFMSEETVVQRDSSDDETTPTAQPEEDEFDRLLQQQIDIARSTPGPNSVKKPESGERKGLLYPPQSISSPLMSDEQRERMLKSRKLAEEKRLARLKAVGMSQDNTIDLTNMNIETNKLDSPLMIDFTNQYETIEISNKNKITNKKTSNIIIDDEVPNLNNYSRDKTHDTDEDAIITDGTNQVFKRSSKVNVIYSSDDEDIAMNESIRVDVHSSKNNENVIGNGHTKDSKSSEVKNTSENRSYVIDSSNEEEIKGYAKAKKFIECDKVNNSSGNISNIDSSEDEDTVMNESILVDIHTNRIDLDTTNSKSMDKAKEFENALNTRGTIIFEKDKLLNEFVKDTTTNVTGTDKTSKNNNPQSNINKRENITHCYNEENISDTTNCKRNNYIEFSTADRGNNSLKTCNSETTDDSNGNLNSNQIILDTETQIFNKENTKNDHTNIINEINTTENSIDEFSKNDAFNMNVKNYNNTDIENINNEALKNDNIDIDRELMDVDFDDDF